MALLNELRLDDGFSTIISFANLATVKLYEKEVTPPGYTAGGPIETTTMRNEAYRTSAPRKLKSVTPMNATVAYATVAYSDIWSQIGVNQLVTVTFPDGASLEFWGWIEEFTPANHVEGEQPTANLVVQPGMRNTTGEEVPPVYNVPESESA